jgi:toxin CcdB
MGGRRVAQFDVFVNPIAAARPHYPFVVVLQSDVVDGRREQIVAPLVPRKALSSIAGRLTPIVTVESSESELVVLAPALAGVRRGDLRQRVASLSAARTEILAAIDLLFFGV